MGSLCSKPGGETVEDPKTANMKPVKKPLKKPNFQNIDEKTPKSPVKS